MLAVIAEGVIWQIRCGKLSAVSSILLYGLASQVQRHLLT